MSELDKILDELVESQVESLIQDDSYYQFLSTPLKPASSIKQQHRKELVDFFKLTELRSQLDLAQDLILGALPDLISPQQFTKVKNEMDASSAHFIQFIQSHTEEDEENKEKPILFQEMFGFSDETLLHVYDLGVSLIGKGKIQDASVVFIFLTTLAPHVSSYWIALGVCYQELNRYQEAIMAFSAAKFLKPMDPASSFYIIESYLALKETEKAKNEIGELKNILTNLEDEDKKTWEQKIKSLIIS